MKQLIDKDNLQYLVFAELYSKFSEPKTRRRAFAILESAISCFARKGFEGTTLAMIAREAGITRQSLDHYFEGLSEIRELSLKYIRLVGQKIVVASINASEDPEVVLRGYLEGHRMWLKNFRTHVRVWLGFLFSSSGNANDRRMNSIAVAAGTERLQGLIAQGVTRSQFQCSDPLRAAKLIQTLLLGWLTTMITEDEDSVATLTDGTLSECLRIAGVKSQPSTK